MGHHDSGQAFREPRLLFAGLTNQRRSSVVVLCRSPGKRFRLLLFVVTLGGLQVPPRQRVAEMSGQMQFFPSVFLSFSFSFRPSVWPMVSGGGGGGGGSSSSTTFSPARRVPLSIPRSNEHTSSTRAAADGELAFLTIYLSHVLSPPYCDDFCFVISSHATIPGFRLHSARLGRRRAIWMCEISARSSPTRPLKREQHLFRLAGILHLWHGRSATDLLFPGHEKF